MKRLLSVALALAGATTLTPKAQAQPPAGFQMTPAMQAQMKAFQKYRDAHKNVTAVQRTLGALVQMDNDPKTKLTKPQAKVALGVLKTWRTKPVMTDAQAKQVNKQLTATLSMAQLKKLATMQSRRGMGGGRPGGPGGSGGQSGPGGPGMRPGGDRPGGGRGFGSGRMPALKDYNPLNPATIPSERMRGRATERLSALTKALAARAK